MLKKLITSMIRRLRRFFNRLNRFFNKKAKDKPPIQAAAENIEMQQLNGSVNAPAYAPINVPAKMGLHHAAVTKNRVKAVNGAAYQTILHECAINPTKENIEKIKRLLSARPELLQQRATVKNRHGMTIHGTVYQIALHESDNNLINNVLSEAFENLDDGLAEMETQRQAWLPADWLEAEEEACVRAYETIDWVFAAFRAASNRDDVTESPEYPYTITIRHQEAREALETFRLSIDALYRPTEEPIISGRDPIIQLLQRFGARYEENFAKLGSYNSPRNNSLLRSVLGYCQRHAPINFMQAFAQGIYYLVDGQENLRRTLEYRHWSGQYILPLDSDPAFRLGSEYSAAGGRASVAKHVDGCRNWMLLISSKELAQQSWRILRDFLSIKNSCVVAIRQAGELNDNQNGPIKLDTLPDEMLTRISNYLPSPTDKAHLASVNRRLHGLFKGEIDKQAAIDAAGCVIHPSDKNIVKLKRLLSICPGLLLQNVTVKDYRLNLISGTIDEIALHQGNDEVISVLKQQKWKNSVRNGFRHRWR